MDQTGNGDRPLDAAALSSWDPPKEEAQRFARFMVSGLSPPPCVTYLNMVPDLSAYGGLLLSLDRISGVFLFVVLPVLS